MSKIRGDSPKSHILSPPVQDEGGGHERKRDGDRGTERRRERKREKLREKGMKRSGRGEMEDEVPRDKR